jgi:hypothetical protein
LKTPLIFSIIAFADSAKDDERYLKAKAAYERQLRCSQQRQQVSAPTALNKAQSESRITTLN